MAQWTMDESSNTGSPIWSREETIYSNRGTTEGVNAVEIANTAIAERGASHTGWNLRTTGTGGRAGRVHFETLVTGTLE